MFTTLIQTFKIKKKYLDVEWLYLNFNVIKLPQIQKNNRLKKVKEGHWIPFT